MVRQTRLQVGDHVCALCRSVRQKMHMNFICTAQACSHDCPSGNRCSRQQPGIRHIDRCARAITPAAYKYHAGSAHIGTGVDLEYRVQIAPARGAAPVKECARNAAIAADPGRSVRQLGYTNVHENKSRTFIFVRQPELCCWPGFLSSGQQLTQFVAERCKLCG